MTAILMIGALLPVGGAKAAESEGGVLKVLASPGIQIYVDGVHRGTTTDEARGLVVTGLAAGTHDVRAVREDCDPKVATVSVGETGAASVAVGELVCGDDRVVEKSFAVSGEAGTAVALDARKGTSTVVQLGATRRAPGGNGSVVFRASGAGLGAGGTVTVLSATGEGTPPMRLFTCADPEGCNEREESLLSAGTYTLEVRFSRPAAGGDTAPFEHVEKVEIEVEADRDYMIRASYGGHDPARCSVRVLESKATQYEGQERRSD